MRRGKLTATLLALLILALPGQGLAEPPLASGAEWLRIEALGGGIIRNGVQEVPWPGIEYRGWTPAHVALRAEAYTPGTGFGFGGFLEGGYEGFGLDASGVRVTEGRLFRATVGPAARWASPHFEVMAGVGYGLTQLPDLGPAAAPEFLALTRHGLMARLGVRVPLFQAVVLEANGQATLLHSGGGLVQGGNGFTAGAALGVPLARLNDRTHLRARVGYELVKDSWMRTSIRGAQQNLHRVGVGLELAFATPTALTIPTEPAPVTDVEVEAAPATGLRLSVSGPKGAPVEGVWARLGEVEVTATDASAPLLLTDLPAGTHSLTVGAPGHRELTEVVQLVEGDTLELSVELLSEAGLAPAVVVGQVRSSQTGRPLKAVLTIEGRDRPVRADAAGRFTLELPDGTWKIRISAPGHLSQRKQLSLREGDRTILNVDLHPERR